MRSRSSKVIKCNFSKSLFLTSRAFRKHFRHQLRSKWGQGHPRSSSAIFQQVYFWPPMHRKSILDIRKGQNQVKAIQGHQVQFHKKCIFDLPCTKKAFWTSGKVKTRSRSSKVIKCNFSKKGIFDLLCVEKYILDIRKGQNQVKVIQGHQVQFFQKGIFDFTWTEIQKRHFRHHGR